MVCYGDKWIEGEKVGGFRVRGSPVGRTVP